MCGKEQGVATRVAEIVPNLFWLQCICHCLHLSMSTACTNSMGSTTNFLQEISNTFAFSNIDHSKFHSIQFEMETKERKNFRHVPTR